MGQISISQAQGIFTDKLQAIYQEKIMPTAFLRSFFVPKESQTKLVSIAVRRGREMAAVDVQRGTEGNRNTFSKGSRKTFLPGYFEEYLDATELDFYDTMWNGTGTVDVQIFKDWLDQAVDALDELISKIDRAYEIMCSQVFESGTVVLASGDNINFGRKAGSLVGHSAATDFATGTVSPYDVIEAGCNFIRTKGKSRGTVLNCIMGSQAHADFMKNDIVLERNDLQSIKLDSIREPQRVSDATLHGEITAGSFRVRIWTYNEYYDTAAGDHNEYINPKKIVILPEAPNFNFMYSGVPQLLGDRGAKEGAGLAGKKGRYHVSEHLDTRKKAHQIIVESAGIPVPVAVDQLYTVQVVAP